VLAALLFPLGTLNAQDQSDTTAPPSDNAVAPADSNYSSPVQPGVQGLERLNNLPAGSFGDSPSGIPYSAGVLTPTGVNLNSTNIFDASNPSAGNYRGLNPGEAEGSASFRAGTEVPLVGHGPEPTDANIKIGSFFVKFHSLDGLLLSDDNYNHSQYDRKSDLLVLLRLNLTVIAQLSDNLQFAVSGSIDYLPLQNQVGVENSLNIGLGLLAPALAAQFAYDTVIAGWPVIFADDFRSGAGFFAQNAGDNFDLFEGNQLYREEAGRYSFRYFQNSQSSLNAPNSPLIYFSNTVSALTNRLLPGDIRLTVSADHINLWYNQSNRGLPSGRDDFLTSLVSERKNQRFKPFVTYEASYIEGIPGVTQSVLAGFLGPIDDQLFLTAGAGYYFATDNHNGALFYVSLDHIAGPYTTEHFLLDRGLSDFDQDQVTFAYYRLDQTIGPTLSAHLFLGQSTYDNLVNGGGSNFNDEIGGLQFNWTISPRTSLSLGGIYERQGGAAKTDSITGRVILNHSLTDTLILQLLYQYQHSVSDGPGGIYYENLVYLRLVKLLD